MSFLRGYARKLGVPEYLGTWNAATNTPALSSSVGQRGGYYVVSNAGSTTLDGISEWANKDWVIFNGTVWEKIDNSEEAQVVDTLAGSETTKAPSVVSVKNYVANVGFSYEVHVAKNGTDSGSTGKLHQPFLTLSAAIAYVESTFTSGEYVAIYVHPGAFLENVTLTRPRTHLVGIQKSNAIIAQIGAVTIAPTAVVGGVYNSSFSVQGLLLSAPSGMSAALTVAGTAECSLHLRDVYLYASTAGQKGFSVTNTSSVKSRFYFNDMLINNQTCNAIGVELANSVSQIKNTTVYSGAAACLKVKSTASALAGFCLFETSGTLAVDLEATTLTIATSSITATQANASGVYVAAGATYTTIQNFYNIASGTGYAIDGATTGVVTHALNAFAFNTNNKYKNVLYMVAHSTSMTASS